MRAARILTLLASAWLLPAAAAAGEKRYCETPEEYVRDFEKMLATRDRAEDQRLKRGPGPAMLGEEEVAAMLLLLKSENWSAREFACVVLGQRRAEGAVDPLIERLKDESDRVRERAAVALGLIGEKRAAGPLLACLGDKKANFSRAGCARALGTLGEKRAVEPLIALLKDRWVGNRRWAAWALGELGDKRAVAPLLPLLKERNRDVVIAAMRALGRLEAAAAYEPILAKLRHKDRFIRSRVPQALGLLGDKRALPFLAALLARDEDRNVRVRAAIALGRLGDARAVPALRKALGDKWYPVQARAAKALYDLKDPQGLKTMLKLFREKGENQHHHPLSSAFAEMGEAAVPIILKGMADTESRRLRGNSALATRYVGEPCVAGTLRLLGHRRVEVRQAACWAFTNNPHPKAIRPLAAILNDPKSGANTYAANALAAIGRPAALELIAAARSRHVSVALPAVDAMGHFRDRRMVPVLIGLTSHVSAEVRASAVGALGRQYDNKALPAAMAKLRDKEPAVRVKVLFVLEQNRWAREYVPQAVAALADESVGVRRTAARTLWALADAAALPGLAARLKVEKDEHARKGISRAIDNTRKAEERRRKGAEKRKKHEAERKKREEEFKKREEERKKREEKKKKKKPPPPPPPADDDEEPL